MPGLAILRLARPHDRLEYKYIGSLTRPDPVSVRVLRVRGCWFSIRLEKPASRGDDW